MTPFGHCKTLEALDLRVFAALLEEVRQRWALRDPTLVALRPRRDEDKGYLWLHVAVVFAPGSPAAADVDGDLELTHWQIAKDLWQLADRWGHCWPVLHRHVDGAVPPGYVAAAAGVAIPDPPAPRVQYVHPAAKAPAPAPEPPPVAAPPTPPPPSAQRSLW